jgi:Helix-turn-helix domain
MRLNRTVTEAIRMERFEELYVELEAGRLSCEGAAMILGCSPRHFLRLRSRYDEDGLSGLKDRRVGRVSHRRAGDAEVEELTRLYRERYEGFNTRHFHEFARRDHSLAAGQFTLSACLAGSRRAGAIPGRVWCCCRQG